MFEKSPQPSTPPGEPTLREVVTPLPLSLQWAERLRQVKDGSFESVLEAMVAFCGERLGVSLSDPVQKPVYEKKLLPVLKHFGQPLLQECSLRRHNDARAELFLARLTSELEVVIPASAQSDRVLLISSGFPLGAGPGSLIALCVEREVAQYGATGLMSLLNIVASKGYCWNESGEYLFREASKRLGDVPTNQQQVLVNAMVHAFCRGAPLEPRANDILAGLGEAVPLATLNRLSLNLATPLFSPEFQRFVRQEVLIALRKATAGCAAEEIAELQGAEQWTLPARLPEVARLAGRHLRETGTVPEDLMAELKLLIRAASSSQPETTGSAEAEHAAQREAERRESSRIAEENNEYEKRYAPLLREQSVEGMLEAIPRMIAEGLHDESTPLSRVFSSLLQEQSLEKLFAVRNVFSRSELVPLCHKESVEGFIRGKARDLIARDDLDALLDAHWENKRFAVSGAESPELLMALRTSLNLKPLAAPVETREATHAARQLWQWMFPKTPFEGSLLEEVVRSHFSKLVARATMIVSNELGNEKALEAVLHYGREIGMLDTYRPTLALLDVPFWKLMYLTAQIRDQLGGKHESVQRLVRYLTIRISETTLGREEFGSKGLLRGDFGQSVQETCADICRCLRGQRSDLDLKRVSSLIVNLKMLDRRLSSTFLSALSDVSTTLVSRLQVLDLQDLLAADTSSLCIVVRAVAAIRYRSTRLLVPLGEEIAARADQIEPQELARVADALGRIQIESTPFWKRFAEHVETHWDEYEKRKELGSLWSLALMAPALVPQRLSQETLLKYPKCGNWLRVYQTLIALGRMLPTEHDETYQKLIAKYDEPKYSSSENLLMRSLPELLHVRPSRIFRNQIIGGCETDLVVDFGTTRLILELDGSIHFSWGPDGGKRDGKDDFQDKVFKKLWYEVVHVKRDDLEDPIRFDEVVKTALRGTAYRIKLAKAKAGPPRRYVEQLGERIGPLLHGEIGEPSDLGSNLDEAL